MKNMDLQKAWQALNQTANYSAIRNKIVQKYRDYTACKQIGGVSTNCLTSRLEEGLRERVTLANEACFWLVRNSTTTSSSGLTSLVTVSLRLAS